MHCSTSDWDLVHYVLASLQVKTIRGSCLSRTTRTLPLLDKRASRMYLRAVVLQSDWLHHKSVLPTMFSARRVAEPDYLFSCCQHSTSGCGPRCTMLGNSRPLRQPRSQFKQDQLSQPYHTTTDLHQRKRLCLALDCTSCTHALTCTAAAAREMAGLPQLDQRLPGVRWALEANPEMVSVRDQLCERVHNRHPRRPQHACQAEHERARVLRLVLARPWGAVF